MTRTVTDETGAVHPLMQRLGRGGQGEVWLVEGGRRVAKLLVRGGDREALRRQIAAVKRLDLRGLDVARPLALLRAPDAGYTAEFLEDMAPVRTLLAPPKGTKVATFYRDKGGLRRRFRLLAHAGEALSALHSKGLIYGDVSHENVFVSAPATADEAWLIDLDNLRIDSDPGRTLFTPGYGAPEVVTGSRGATSYSDAWAFAVLVFRTLTLNHPFCGDLVADGEPELEEEAFAGRLPWVLAADERNRATRGIRAESVLTKRLLELSKEMFEAGVSDRMKRPSIAAWVEHLHRAADLSVRCAACQSTFLVSAAICPFCDEPRPLVDLVFIHRWEPGRGVVPMGTRGEGEVERVPLGSEPFQLLRRHTHVESGKQGRQPVALLEPVDRGVLVRPVAGAGLWVTAPGVAAGAVRQISERGLKIPFDEKRAQSHVIHFRPIDQPQRVITFRRGQR